MKFNESLLINILHLSNVYLSVELKISRFFQDSTRNTSRYLIYHRTNANLTKEGNVNHAKQGSTRGFIEKEKDGRRKLTMKATREGEDEKKVGS